MDVENRLEVRYRKADMQEPVLISTPEGVDRFIDALLEGPEFHDAAHVLSTARPRVDIGFPDHELYVGVDGESSVGVLVLSLPETGCLVSVGPPGSNGKNFYHVAEQPIELPSGSGIPIPLIREGVKEFLSSGGKLPGCIEWRPYGVHGEPVEGDDIWVGN
ncbi:Imm1 family immunity protein [Kitasatospora cineracea]